MPQLKPTLRTVLAHLLAPLPAAPLRVLLREVITARTQRMPPAEGLRFVFGLDADMYRLQGQLAGAYGGGLHSKHRLIGYHDFFVARVQPGERVLDIGCGIGAVAFDLAERARAHVVGIDLIAANIRQAHQRHSHPRIAYVVGDALQTLPARRFDVVVLSNVLEHLPQRPDFLRRVQQTVQPARMLIRVPLFERDWRVPLKRELGVEWRLDTTHETEYTQESFAAELTAAGLRTSHQEIRWGEIWAEVQADA